MTGAEASISIVMPALNEAASIAAAVADARRHAAECLVVDGGSSDRTAALAFEAGAIVIGAPRGRAVQMNAGAERACSDVLLFVHADCRLPDHAAQSIRAAIASGAAWGRFDVKLDSPRRSLRLVGAMMNWRSRLSGIATGDQAMFVRREVFEQLGGFPDIELMEDIALSRKLKALGRPVCLRPPVITSARRWLRHGIWLTIWLMWRLRAAYFFGADPDALALRYGYRPRSR